MSYTHDRDQFIDRMSREGLPFAVTLALLRAATTMQRYAELACSSEAADRDRVPCPASTKRGAVCLCDDYPTGTHAAGNHSTVTRIAVKDHRLEQRIRTAMPAGWAIDTQGDPRGYVLRVIPPSYSERNKGRDRFNLDTIGVPSGPTRLRF